HEVALELRRLAEDEVAVDGEALGAVQQHLDFGRLETRCAVNRVDHQYFEVLPIFGKQLKLESLGNLRHIPGFGDRLEAANYQASYLLLVVKIAIGVAHHWQIGTNAGDGFGDDVEM